MYAAKCLTIFVVLIGLAVMWILSRKKTNQILLAFAASILVGGALRLLQMKDNEQSMYVVGAALAGMGLIWLLSWLSNRSATRRPRAPKKP